MDKQNDIEFDLVELLLYIRRKIAIILLVVVLFSLGGFVYTKLFITPEYTATARIHVFQYSESNQAGIYNIQIATTLRRDFEILITGKDVAAQVVEEMELSMSPGYITNGLSVEAEDNTRIMDLSYVDTDPVRAAEVLNKVCDVAEKKFEGLMKDEDIIQIVYRADPPTSPSSPTAWRNALVAAIVGFAVVLVVLIVVYLLDDTIRTEDDVEKRLGMSTLSSVPVCDELASLRRVGDSRPAKKKFRRGRR